MASAGCIDWSMYVIKKIKEDMKLETTTTPVSGDLRERGVGNGYGQDTFTHYICIKLLKNKIQR